MRRLIRRLRSRTAAFAHDLLMIPVAWLGAYWLRFNLGAIPDLYLDTALALLPVVMVVNGGVFWYLGLYRGVWRFASLPDLVRIVKAVVVGAALATIATFLLTRMEAVPRSVIPLQALLLVLLLGGPRLLYRLVKDRNLYGASAKSVLIVGAGDAGEGLVRDLLRNPQLGLRPVAFVDDDPAKKGMEIRGLRVLAKTRKLPTVVAERRIDLVLLAIPSAGAREMRRAVELCERAEVGFRTVPPLENLVAGTASLVDLREVAIEDLLGREPVSLDWQSMRTFIEGRKILVTGGAGSIGAELCRQLASLAPASLCIIDQSEYGLYRIEQELGSTFAQLELKVRLADVGDRAGVDWVMANVRPDVVFHAAAYKHVPMLETQLREAIRNNVIGTRNVASSAADHEVPVVVLISTDKAVNPTNVMGASKRLAEIYCQNANRVHNSTRYITVRFGNVLGSAGSVVPLFREQIARGGPVTVTDPKMQRYFMTIPEACQLILEAGAVGHGGEIFVLDMGEPVSIRYLAEKMISLAGKRVGEDVEIVYSGVRPGEKLFEELFHAQENLSSTGRDKLLLAQVRAVDWTALNTELDTLVDACTRYDERAMLTVLASLVPEYQQIKEESNNVIPLERHKS
jgi:FlaA1/EpsC-like NDP-sugar epimerase